MSFARCEEIEDDDFFYEDVEADNLHDADDDYFGDAWADPQPVEKGKEDDLYRFELAEAKDNGANFVPFCDMPGETTPKFQ